MAKSVDLEKEIWGTWEELLLACAVNRHGTKSWESVAMEIQNRISPSLYLTPQNCRKKYQDLQRRFMADIENQEGSRYGSATEDDKEIPWLEELRKLRVAELRREVQRYDVSIVSLQLKVKKLEEDRERSLKEEENGREKSDLEKDLEKKPCLRKKDEDEGGAKVADEEVTGVATVAESVPEKNTRKDFSGRLGNDESDHENESFNGSNSMRSFAFKSDPKGENQKNASAEAKIPEERILKLEEGPEIPAGKPDPVSGDLPEVKAREPGVPVAAPPSPLDSYNGSSETIAKELPERSGGKFSGDEISPDFVGPADFQSETKDAGGFQESYAESDEGQGVGDGEKDNSDVQSSVSLSRKQRRKKNSGSSSGEDQEIDYFFPARNMKDIGRNHARKPLLFKECLETIRFHKHGSVFESRLESQENSDYDNLIRQHVDLGMVKTKLGEGSYPGSLEFFRDLLLLFNNALVYFPKNSPEFTAANELRELVSKEMANTIYRPEATSSEPTTTTQQTKEEQKSNPEPAITIPLKPNPIVACRKRSSISANQTDSSKIAQSVAESKEEQKSENDGKKLDQEPENVKEAENSSANVVEGVSTAKKRTVIGRERSAKGSRSNKKRGSNPDPKNLIANVNSNLNPNSNQSAVKTHSSDAPESKPVVEEKKNITVAKKRSAANFLYRIKRNSAPGTLLETLKNSGNGRGEQKKGNRGDGRKEQVSRQGGTGKKPEEHVSPAKKSVGRPPKKATPPARQRGREAAHEALASRTPRKRARR